MMQQQSCTTLIDFMAALRKCFKDPLTNQNTRMRIKTIRQGRRPVTIYIQEFCSLAYKLFNWLQNMLIEWFQKGLSNEIYTCLCRGAPWTFHGWYILIDIWEMSKDILGLSSFRCPDGKKTCDTSTLEDATYTDVFVYEIAKIIVDYRNGIPFLNSHYRFYCTWAELP